MISSKTDFISMLFTTLRIYILYQHFT